MGPRSQDITYISDLVDLDTVRPDPSVVNQPMQMYGSQPIQHQNQAMHAYASQPMHASSQMNTPHQGHGDAPMPHHMQMLTHTPVHYADKPMYISNTPVPLATDGSPALSYGGGAPGVRQQHMSGVRTWPATPYAQFSTGADGQEMALNASNAHWGRPEGQHSVEPFISPLTCLDAANHVTSCLVCSRLYRNDNTILIIIIVVLAIIGILLFKRVMKL